MTSARIHRSSARRFAWLLWLGLLLPIAQLAAATHALSHARQAAGRDDPAPQSPHLVHCDLCLAGAAIGGAAPPSAAPLAILASPATSLPSRGADAVVGAAPVLAYRSRAPPHLAS